MLVTGATGFIGSRLVPALVDDGPPGQGDDPPPRRLRRPGRPGRRRRLRPRLAGRADGRASTSRSTSCTRSTTTTSSARTPRPPGRFGLAAAASGVRQIVYMGGLGKDDVELSPHLRSRREVEKLLGVSGVPVTVLRAAIVVGAGGISWEMTRQLVKNLPAMVVPQVGRHPHPADRARRRDPLPGRRDRRREDLRPGLRDRRRRPAHLRADAPAGRRGHQRPPGPDRHRAGADPAAVVAAGSAWSPTSTPPPPATSSTR